MPKLPWPSRLEHYHDFRFQRQFILARSARLPGNKLRQNHRLILFVVNLEVSPLWVVDPGANLPNHPPVDKP